MNTLPKVLRSSENPANVSLTIKSLIVLVIIYGAKQAGFDVSEAVSAQLAETLIVIVAGMGTIYGIIRKVINEKNI